MSCETPVLKICSDEKCTKHFVDIRWCGTLTCNRCLKMCWLVNDKTIIDRIFNCCDYHRPFVTLTNVRQHSDKIKQPVKEEIENETLFKRLTKMVSFTKKNQSNIPHVKII